jgi:hypothetical protein
VRALAAERLSDLPLLSRPSAGTLKSTSRRTGAASLAAKSGSNTSRSHQVPMSALGPEQSATTAASTTGTAGASDSSLLGGKSSRSVAGTLRGGAADEVLLSGEYVKVIELLKKRGEKGHMILAQSEVSSKGFTDGMKQWSSPPHCCRSGIMRRLLPAATGIQHCSGCMYDAVVWYMLCRLRHLWPVHQRQVI